MNKLIKKSDIKPLLAEASKRRNTWVPLSGPGGEAQFKKLESMEELKLLDLDYGALVIPPKTHGFPMFERMFDFKGNKITDSSPAPDRSLLFGLRACDLRGILFCDNFFGTSSPDSYYMGRVKDRLLVLVGCLTPPRECFCASAGTGPFLEKGYDLQLTDLGNDYLVETGSEGGEIFVARYERYFKKAKKTELARATKEKKEATGAVNRKLKIPFGAVISSLRSNEIPRDICEEIAQRCIHCGGCLYVCPTCTCFNVFDVKDDKGGARFRNWDACVFSGYTREAGGRNPRSEKWKRAARRYEHKLKYDYKATGESGCVGCGRCLYSCPVNIGMAGVIEKLARGKAAVKKKTV